MGLDNPIHLMILLVILLLVFGAKRLPEMGHSLGHGLRGFKDALSGEPAVQHLDAAAPPSTAEVSGSTATVAETTASSDPGPARVARPE